MHSNEFEFQIPPECFDHQKMAMPALDYHKTNMQKGMPVEHSHAAWMPMMIDIRSYRGKNTAPRGWYDTLPKITQDW